MAGQGRLTLVSRALAGVMAELIDLSVAMSVSMCGDPVGILRLNDVLWNKSVAYGRQM